MRFVERSNDGDVVLTDLPGPGDLVIDLRGDDGEDEPPPTRDAATESTRPA